MQPPAASTPFLDALEARQLTPEEEAAAGSD
jgi:hypothetical protein